MARQDLGRGSRERRASGQQLVAQDAEGVDVHPVIHVGIGRGLFRRHVGRRAERDAGGGQILAAGRFAHRLGHAEVGDQGVAAGDQHVVGLDVAVDHALAVGVGQRVGDLGRDPDGVGDRQLAEMVEAVAQVVAVHVRHHVVEEARGFAGIVEGEDVGMLEPGGDLDLAEEALGAQRGGQLGPENLDGDFSAVAEVGGQVDHGHAALTQLALQRVAVGQRGGELGGKVGHPSPWEGTGPNLGGSCTGRQRISDWTTRGRRIP